MAVQEDSDDRDDDNDDMVKSDDVFVQSEKKENKVFVLAVEHSKMDEGMKKTSDKKNKKQQLIHFLR